MSWRLGLVLGLEMGFRLGSVLGLEMGFRLGSVLGLEMGFRLGSVLGLEMEQRGGRSIVTYPKPCCEWGLVGEMGARGGVTRAESVGSWPLLLNLSKVAVEFGDGRKGSSWSTS